MSWGVVGGALAALLFGCGGPAGDGDGTGGGPSGGSSATGGSSGSGGSNASGGTVGSGGAPGTGGSDLGGSPGTGGTDPGHIDPDDLGRPCEAGSCPSGLTPTNFEICGIASCDTVCECHLPCTADPDSCPEELSCMTGGFNLPENVCR